tara:strand:+ start:804 stop:977 length:174 start_codon:yes stop_codon:yes gene_type:complete
MEEENPSFILFYKNGMCCAIIGTREEAHMDLSSILMKYDIDINQYIVPDWSFLTGIG